MEENDDHLMQRAEVESSADAEDLAWLFTRGHHESVWSFFEWLDARELERREARAEVERLKR